MVAGTFVFNYDTRYAVFVAHKRDVTDSNGLLLQQYSQHTLRDGNSLIYDDYTIQLSFCE